MLKIVEKYSNASRELINQKKSGLYTGLTCLRRRAQNMVTWIGRFHKQLTVDYLGVPLFKGRVQRRHFEAVEDKINKRINGWKTKLLSFGGKLALLKSI